MSAIKLKAGKINIVWDALSFIHHLGNQGVEQSRMDTASMANVYILRSKLED